MDTAIAFSVPINGHVAYGWVRPGKGWNVASDLFPEGYTRNTAHLRPRVAYITY